MPAKTRKQIALFDLERDLPRRLRAMYRRDVSKAHDAGAETVADLCELLTDPRTNREMRIISCWLLGVAAQPSSAPHLIRQYRSKGKALIWEAAKALAKIGGRRTAQMFMAALLRRGEDERRVAAAWALGTMRVKKSVPALVGVLQNAKNTSRLRGEAAEALGNIGDRHAVPALLAATFDAATEVRFWAIFALGQIADARSLPRLRQLTSKDHARLRGWGTVTREASLAIRQLKQRLAWGRR